MWDRRELPFALAVVFILTRAMVPATLGAASVQGTVQRADGSPLSGARVALLRLPNNFAALRDTARERGDAQPAAMARSAEDGRFRLTPHENGVFKVRVRATGYLAMAYFLLPVAGDVELPPLILWPAAQATVTVTDPHGRPLAGIGVYAQSENPKRWRQRSPGGWRPWLRLAYSDDDGQATLARARDEVLALHLFKPGVAQLERPEASGRKRVVFEPPARGPQVLLLRGGDGSPVAGAVVAFGDLALPIGGSDAEGRLSLAGTDDAPVKLLLLSADGRSLRLSYDPPATGAHDAPPSELRFPAAVHLAGRVLERASGAPIAGAVVWPTHDPGRFVLSGEDGRFDILAPAAERYRVQVHAKAHIPSLVTLSAGHLSRPETPDIRLAAAGTLAGVVVDPAGEPIAGVELVARRSSATERRILRLDPADARARSDAEGRFQLAPVAVGASVLVGARKRGWTTGRFTVEPPAGEHLRLVLERGRRVIGRVVDAEDQPVQDATVRLLASGQPESLQAAGDRAAGDRGPGDGDGDGKPDAGEQDPFRALTLEDGRFELRKLPAQRIYIAAAAHGFAPMTVRGIEVPAGDSEVDLGTLVLEPGVAIHGSIHDPQGAPIVDAQVWAFTESVPSARLLEAQWDRARPACDARSDARGSFVVADLEPRHPVHLRLDAAGYLPAILMNLAPGAREPLDVVLELGAQLSGQVVNAQGAAVADAEISLSLQPSPDDPGALDRSITQSRHTSSGEDGRFVVADVVPGHHLADAFADGYQPAPAREIELVAGAPRDDLRFVLRPGALLTGSVRDGEGLAITGAQVLVGRPSGRSDEAGVYRVAGLPLGRQQVDVRHRGYNRHREEVEIDAGENHLDVVLAGGRRVSGQVLGESGQAIAGATLELRAGGADSFAQQRATSAGDGHFTFPHVADGRYNLVATKDGYASDQGANIVRVEGQGIEGIELTLLLGAKLRGSILGLDFEQLAQVEVRAEADDRPARSGEVDFEGHYQIADLGPGDWLVKAQLADGRRQAQARVSLARGDTEAERDLEFGRGVTLTGVVLYGGEPLPDTRVQVNGADVPVKRTVVTGFDGRFEVADLPPGTYQLGFSQAAERLIHNQRLVLGEDRDVVIEIRTARISGQIISATTGEPLERALVSLLQEFEGGRTGSLFTIGSDAEGRFELPRLTAGRYRVSVQLDGFKPAEQRLEVATGADLSGLLISLEPTEGLVLALRLASGRRPRFVTVKALEPAGSAVMTQTRVVAADGTANFATMPAGTWELLITASGGALVRTRVTVPGEPLEVVLPDAGRLKVRIAELVESDEIGLVTIQSSEGRAFLRMDANGEIEQSWSLVAGHAVIDDLPAGHWSVQVVTPDGRSWAGSAATTGGPDLELNLE